MTKTTKYYLQDYTGKKHAVKIPEGTTEVAGVNVSGDEVMVYPVYRDPMIMDRMYDNLDGYWHKKLVDGEWTDVEEKQ